MKTLIEIANTSNWDWIDRDGGYEGRIEREEITDILPDQFIVFYFTTTGPDHLHDEVVELGAIKATPKSNNHIAIHALIKQQKRLSINVIAETGITRNMVENHGTNLYEAMTDFVEFCGDLPLVTYDAKHNKDFLRSSLLRASLMKDTPRHEFNTMGIHGSDAGRPVVCVLDMARRAWPYQESHELTDLVKMLDGRTAMSESYSLQKCELAFFVYAQAAKELDSPA